MLFCSGFPTLLVFVTIVVDLNNVFISFYNCKRCVAIKININLENIILLVERLDKNFKHDLGIVFDANF